MRGLTNRDRSSNRARGLAAISRRVLPAVLLTLAVTAAGCQEAPPPGDEPAEIVGDAVLAVAFSAPLSQLGKAAEGGRIVLINGAGARRASITTGMDAARLAWTSNGLAFSDRLRDVVLSDRLRVEDRGSVEQEQVALLGLGNTAGDGFLAVFAGKSRGGAGRSTVTRFTATSTRSATVPLRLEVVGRCGGQVFGIGRRVNSAGVVASRSEMARLWPGEPGKPVRLSGLAGPLPPIGAVPCPSGRLRILATTAPGPTAAAAAAVSLVSVDTRTARATYHALTQSGKRIMQPADAMVWARYSSSTVRGGQLSWVSADGSAYRTTLATGATKLARSGLPRPRAGEYRYVFQSGLAFAVGPLGNPAGVVSLSAFRLDRFTDLPKLAFPGLAALQNPQSVIRDVAVRPGYRP